MKNRKDLLLLHEQKIITRCLLEGMTLKQIAQILHCAKSSASYKTKKLFSDWNASDRHEFIINIFTKIIDKYKNEIQRLKDIINKQ